jgi:hypothetical protein
MNTRERRSLPNHAICVQTSFQTKKAAATPSAFSAFCDSGYDFAIQAHSVFTAITNPLPIAPPAAPEKGLPRDAP